MLGISIYHVFISVTLVTVDQLITVDQLNRYNACLDSS